MCLQTSIKFLQKFHKCFASVSRIIVTNYSHGFNKIFYRTFIITLIQPTIFLKFCAKILFCFDTVLRPHFFFLNVTKIVRHYFYKTYKIFEKFDGVSRTFSINTRRQNHATRVYRRSSAMIHRQVGHKSLVLQHL